VAPSAPLCVRTEQRAYHLAAGVALMLAGVALRLRHPVLGGVLLTGFPLLLVLARFERIEFDGDLVRRTGFYALLMHALQRQPRAFRTAEIELIATEASRLRFHSGRVRYRYRTIIIASGGEFVLYSTTPGYQPFVKLLFQAAGESKLDPRSSELLHYLDATAHFENVELRRELLAQLPTQLLRSVANHMRLAGRMRQAMDFFTLAHQREPNNPHLLYEMGRFLRSMAATENPRLLNRSNACLRLAARISLQEPHLLERIGETYFERYDYERATRCFTRAIEIDPSLFRARIGLAEIALRAGKLARVAHFYYEAAYATTDAAQNRLARREAQYYERLSNDDEYLEAEVRRMASLHSLRRMRVMSAVVFCLTWLVVGLFGRTSETLEEAGLAAMISAGMTWISTLIGFQWRRKRIAFREATSE
jgi:tetratricopeptide (TPR) repeat protein